MNLGDVMDELARAMTAITGVTVHPFPPGSISGPTAYVAYPQSVNYDQSYGRGEDEIADLPVVFLRPRPTDQSTRDQAAKWASGSGEQSVKAAAEAWDWKTCDDLTINSVEFDVWEVAGVPYLALMFVTTVSGPGEE